MQRRHPPHRCPLGIDRSQLATSASLKHFDLIVPKSHDPCIIGSPVYHYTIVPSGDQHRTDILAIGFSKKLIDEPLSLNGVVDDQGSSKTHSNTDAGHTIPRVWPGRRVESLPPTAIELRSLDLNAIFQDGAHRQLAGSMRRDRLIHRVSEPDRRIGWPDHVRARWFPWSGQSASRAGAQYD